MGMLLEKLASLRPDPKFTVGGNVCSKRLLDNYLISNRYITTCYEFITSIRHRLYKGRRNDPGLDHS